MTRGRRLTTPRARRASAVVALALFGLLSMHGWGTHAGMHPTDGSPPRVVLVHDGEPAVAPSPTTHHPAGHDTAGHELTGTDEVTGDDAASAATMAGLCLAVLAGLVLTLALLRQRRAIRPLSALLPAFRAPMLLGRERDPPDLVRLCVIRC